MPKSAADGHREARNNLRKGITAQNVNSEQPSSSIDSTDATKKSSTVLLGLLFVIAGGGLTSFLFSRYLNKQRRDLSDVKQPNDSEGLLQRSSGNNVPLWREDSKSMSKPYK